MSKEKVAVLGASDDPDRYAYKAFKLLEDHGHKTFLVSPKLSQIDGQKVYPKLNEIKEPIDTLTMYVNPKISSDLTQDILALKPKRVIFNPGSENSELVSRLKENGIASEEACTLVLLRTGQF